MLVAARARRCMRVSLTAGILLAGRYFCFRGERAVEGPKYRRPHHRRVAWAEVQNVHAAFPLLYISMRWRFNGPCFLCTCVSEQYAEIRVFLSSGQVMSRPLSLFCALLSIHRVQTLDRERVPDFSDSVQATGELGETASLLKFQFSWSNRPRNLGPRTDGGHPRSLSDRHESLEHPQDFAREYRSTCWHCVSSSRSLLLQSSSSKCPGCWHDASAFETLSCPIPNGPELLCWLMHDDWRTRVRVVWGRLEISLEM